MKHFSKISKIGVFFLSLSFLSVSSVHAQWLDQTPAPSFSCGPFMETYVVSSPDYAFGEGIRCVKWNTAANASKRTLAFAWYGEGRWDAIRYRHVGQAFSSPLLPTDTYQGYATNMYGNGENAKGDFQGNLAIKVFGHDTIQVTGGWTETWSRVSSASYTMLPAPMTCGRDFDQYTAQSLDTYAAMRMRKRVSARRGEGVRCVMRTGGSNKTWLGFGTWDGKYYMHLVTKSGSGYGSSDFCTSNQDYCGSVPFGGIRKRVSPTWKKPIIDGWNEIWLKR